jgi:hypothetical protein
VKRFVLLVLLAVLPLQMTWAGVANCPRGEHRDAYPTGPADLSAADDAHRHADAFHVHDAHSDGGRPHAHDAPSDGGAHHAHDGHRHGDDHGTSGHAGGSGFDCSPFHFVAVAPPGAIPQSLPCPGAAVAHAALLAHESHIPDGLERPNWRPAA